MLFALLFDCYLSVISRIMWEGFGSGDSSEFDVVEVEERGGSKRGMMPTRCVVIGVTRAVGVIAAAINFVGRLRTIQHPGTTWKIYTAFLVYTPCHILLASVSPADSAFYFAAHSICLVYVESNIIAYQQHSFLSSLYQSKFGRASCSKARSTTRCER